MIALSSSWIYKVKNGRPAITPPVGLSIRIFTYSSCSASLSLKIGMVTSTNGVLLLKVTVVLVKVWSPLNAVLNGAKRGVSFTEPVPGNFMLILRVAWPIDSLTTTNRVAKENSALKLKLKVKGLNNFLNSASFTFDTTKLYDWPEVNGVEYVKVTVSILLPLLDMFADCKLAMPV